MQAGAENLTSGNAYLLGDANLDGAVDVTDFNIWNGSKFAATGSWSLGYFNADGSTDISDHIRTPEISMLASAVSAKPVVREYLLTVQKDIGRRKAAVFEGRDMGTVVFPEADVKFFLNASSQTRARRRYDEMKSTSDQSLNQVEKDMQRRDRNDSTRRLAPLKPADDAIYIDSTDLSIKEVVESMLAHIARLKA